MHMIAGMWHSVSILGPSNYQQIFHEAVALYLHISVGAHFVSQGANLQLIFVLIQYWYSDLCITTVKVYGDGPIIYIIQVFWFFQVFWLFPILNKKYSREQ